MKNFQLTRQEMVDHINNGGSVMHDGEIITSVSGLPSPASLAKGDPASAAQTRKELMEEQARILAQLSELENDDFEPAPPKLDAKEIKDDKPKVEVAPSVKPMRDPETGKPIKPETAG